AGDGLEEHAGLEDDTLGRVGVVADGVALAPLGAGGDGEVAGAADRVPGQVGEDVGERGLPGTWDPRQQDVPAGVEGGDELGEEVPGVEQSPVGGARLQVVSREICHKCSSAPPPGAVGPSGGPPRSRAARLVAGEAQEAPGGVKHGRLTRAPWRRPMNRIREALAEQRPSFGAWVVLPSPLTAEFMGGAGFDWVIVDAQHGGLVAGDLVPILQALQLGGTPAVVRVPWTDQPTIMRVLDFGAAGVLV